MQGEATTDERITLASLVPHFEVTAEWLRELCDRMDPSSDDKLKGPRWSSSQVEALLIWLHNYCVLSGKKADLREAERNLRQAIGRRSPKKQPDARGNGGLQILDRQDGRRAQPRALDLDRWELDVLESYVGRITTEEDAGRIVLEALQLAGAVAVIDPYLFTKSSGVIDENARRERREEATLDVLAGVLHKKRWFAAIAGYSNGNHSCHEVLKNAKNTLLRVDGLKAARVAIINKDKASLHDRFVGIWMRDLNGLPDVRKKPGLLRPDLAFAVGPGLRVVGAPPGKRSASLALVEPGSFEELWQRLWPQEPLDALNLVDGEWSRSDVGRSDCRRRIVLDPRESKCVPSKG